MRLLTRASLRYLASHRLQLLLSILGVSLGVAVVLSIDLTIESAKTAFRISAETVSGRATHAVVGDAGSLDDDLLATIRIDLGVPAAAPIVEGFARSSRLRGRALRVLGIDPFSEGPFRPFVAGGESGVDVSDFMTTPRAVSVSSDLAGEAGVEVGDVLEVEIAGERFDLRVVGTVEPTDDSARGATADLLLMDIAGAQEVLGSIGQLSRIDLRLSLEGEREELRRIAQGLPPSVRVEPVGTRTATMSGMISAFDVNLTALSLLALIFGMFLIYNAVVFSVVQRREILGRLRSIGVTRGEIARMILLESLLVGCAGAVIGGVAGLALADGLLGLVSQTINDFYFSVSVRELSVDFGIVAKAMALGVGMTVVSSLPAVIEATGVNPRLSALRSVVESRARRFVPRAAAWGLTTSLVGALVLLLPTRSLPVSFFGLFLVMSGLAAATPWGTLGLVRTVRPALGLVGGTLGLMAARGVGSSLSRTAPAVAALTVAVAVTVGLGVMIQSFRGTLESWLDHTLRADIYVSLPSSGVGRATGTLGTELVSRLTTHPEIEGFSTYRGFDVVRAGDAYHFVALDLHPRGEQAFRFISGDNERIMRAFQSGDGVIVSEPFAVRRGLSRDDDVALGTDQGERAFRILGVFYDYGSEQGTVMMARSLYGSLFDDPGVTSLGLFLQGGAASDDVVRDLLQLVPPDRTVIARTNDTLRSASLQVFDRTFRVTAVLRLLAFVVAFVGVLSALAALQLERARELGLLRAQGLTPGQLRRLVVTQTTLMGASAGILAVPMGLALSVVMIFVVNKRAFGWSLNMEVGPEVVVQALALAVVAAVLAGLYPAWRMAKTSAGAALRGE